MAQLFSMPKKSPIEPALFRPTNCRQVTQAKKKKQWRDRQKRLVSHGFKQIADEASLRQN
jgi:hypothetical protein